MVCMNGSENVHKTPEIERRAKKAQEAEEFHSTIGQIKNTPEYIEKACHVCKSLSNPSSVDKFNRSRNASFFSSVLNNVNAST